MARLSLTAALTSAALALPLLGAGAHAQTYTTQSGYAPANQSYQACLQQQRNRQVAGAVIGGVLGAVIGAELHDDHQDRNRARGHRGHRDRGYRDRGYRDRYGYRDRRGYRGRHHEEGNDGAVLAGAGLGALAGAAVAGQATGCEHLRQTGYGATGGYAPDYGYADPAYGQPTYQGGYGGYGGYDGYDPAYDPGYANRSSGDVLLGGQDYDPRSGAYSAPAPSAPPARTYTAGATSVAPASACRNMQSGNGAVTWMCQGQDGVWRPANSYQR